MGKLPIYNFHYLKILHKHYPLCNRYILLTGNGFNMNFGIKSDYENLASRIIQNIPPGTEINDKLRQIIDENRNDLEVVLVDLNPELRKTFLSYFGDALTTIVEESINFSDNLAGAAKFINKFSKIFTLNFDHFLYRTFLRANTLLNNDEHFTDGFRGRGEHSTWKACNSQNIFNLHGNLHSLATEGIVTKHILGSSKRLPDRIKQHIQAGGEINCVLFPTSCEKLKSIEDNEYMNHSLKNLKEQNGSVEPMPEETVSIAIFLYGVSLDEKDKHIWDAIDNNQYIQRVHISYCGNHFSIDYANFVDRAKGAFPHKAKRNEIYFFDSQSINTFSPPIITNSNILGVCNV